MADASQGAGLTADDVARFAQEAMEASIAEGCSADSSPAREARPATRTQATSAKPRTTKTKARPKQEPQAELAVQESYFRNLRPADGSGVKAVQPMQFISLEEAARLESADYTVKRLFPAQGVALVYGEPATGKSFTMLSTGGYISEGWFICGRRVKARAVYYLSLEGSGGLGKRIKGFKLKARELGRPELQGIFRFWTHGFALNDPAQCDALIKAILDAGHQGAVVIIDTLSQSTLGLDENSSDMAVAIGNATRIAESIGGLVVLVHHVGKVSANGPRGHSSLMGNVDCAIHVRRAQGWEGVEWVVTKSKDDAEGQVVGFKLHVVDLGPDADGDTVTTCAAEPFQPSEEERQAQDDAEKKSKKPKLARSVQTALRIFNDAIRKHGKAGWLDVAKFREAFMDDYEPASDDPKAASAAARQAYKAALENLQNKGFVRRVKDRLQNLQTD